MINIKVLLTLLVLSISLDCQSQISKIKLGGLSTFHTPIRIEGTHEISESERFIDFGYNKTFSLGVIAEYPIMSRISVELGLNYIQRDFESRYICECDYDLIWAIRKFNNRFLAVPVSTKIYLSDNRISPFLLLGVVNQFKISDGIELKERKYLLTGRTGLGAEFDINDVWDLFFIFDYTRALNKLYVDQYMKNEFLGYGFGLTLKPWN